MLNIVYSGRTKCSAVRIKRIVLLLLPCIPAGTGAVRTYIEYAINLNFEDQFTTVHFLRHVDFKTKINFYPR